MKKLLFIICFLLMAQTSWAAIARVGTYYNQTPVGDSGTTNPVVVSGFAGNAGDAVFVFIFGSGNNTYTVASNGSDTFTQKIRQTSSSNGTLNIWAIYNSSGTTTQVTVTPGGSDYSTVYVLEYSGLGATPTLDTSNSSWNVGVTSITQTFSTTGANDLILNCLDFSGTAGTAWTDASGSLVVSNSSSTYGYVRIDESLNDPAGSQNFSWSWTTSSNALAGYIAITASGGGGGGGGCTGPCTIIFEGDGLD